MAKNFIVETSARHVHVTKDDVKVLFGDGYELTKKVDLSQPGQFACEEQVTIKGPKGEFERVRILGPERSRTQVEVAKTDTFKLGIEPPVRNSGDLDDAVEITIIGPMGSVTKNAAIIASRHLHIDPKTADELNLTNDDFVKVRVGGEKSGLLEHVFVRVDENFVYEVHLDTDDANAFLIKQGDEAELIIDKEL